MTGEPVTCKGDLCVPKVGGVATQPTWERYMRASIGVAATLPIVFHWTCRFSLGKLGVVETPPSGALESVEAPPSLRR